MLDFDAELEKFEPSPDVDKDKIENAVNSNNLADVTDIVRELIQDSRNTL